MVPGRIDYHGTVAMASLSALLLEPCLDERSILILAQRMSGKESSTLQSTCHHR